MIADTSESHHVIAGHDFHSLARGHGDAESVRQFTVTERSWRLVGLRHLLATLTDEQAGPLPPVADAWKLILRAEEADEDAVTDTVMYPQVGIWIAHLLRRLGGVVTDTEPLWTDVGYLHAVAAVAAVRAGLAFAVDVPVRAGVVVLPALGMARFPDATTGVATVASPGRRDDNPGDDNPGEDGPVTVSLGDTVVRLAADDPAWRPAPRCHADVDGARIAFLLDDVDPYRDLRGYSAPAPLPPADLARWQELLTAAWTILVRQDRARAEGVAAALTTLIPLPAAKPYRPLSASCDEAFAAIVASMPDDAEQFAMTLVHETQHVKLGALLHLVTFVDDPDGPAVYAPWRDDPRPLSGLLQGVYAFVGITDFWRRRTDPGSRFEAALWGRQLRRVLAALRTDSRLSPFGERLVAELYDTVTGWPPPPADADTTRLAASAAADHYAQWRALHVAAPEDWVREAVLAWNSGGPRPAIPATVIAPVTDTSARWLDGRAVLARIHLTDPAQFAALLHAPGAVADTIPGTLPADLSLITGDAAAALEGYRAHLVTDRGSPRAWAGLGLALDALGRPAADLLEHPELARALARALPGADPLTVADWMTGAAAPC
ncbi:HEXXH motif domain-containing protein [Actinoplanes sp. NBRC 101535]|uniref:HEXXH motif domain-containing protein n=1 Tax=Actinoplanes sp. NBRC 101535 TaxID=3032196 RepID=UPI0024A2AF49|nr:HEXXH motif domain-containing protein [Actinoplanes sp. NBRC 101535]GLY07420.1 HEXXH motif domain-containing protein [Actinoplanes sp. NBRC 101535]